MPGDSGVPPKRCKLEHAKDGPEEVQRSPTKHISVKREPSPTPPPSLALRTSGTVRIDIPDDCLKSQPGWEERRDKWVAEETLKLKALGLKIPKRLIRVDGLALDWVSAAPVCPFTLRPPSPVLSSTQAHQPQQVPSKQPLVDPLGHALRDQTVSSHLSNTSGPMSFVHTQTSAPRENGRESLPSVPAVDDRVKSDFVVVGAATHKEPEGPGSERAGELAPDDTVQWEHRKLLPPDLRPSTQLRCANKESPKDRKARRLAWITKEIEKVEGYTGEKVGGFRYDGDDVIIHLSKGLYRARRSNGQARHIPVRLPQLDRRQPRTSHASSTCPQSKRILSTTPAYAFRESHAADSIPPHPQGSVTFGSGTTTCRASIVAADVPIPHPKSQVAKSASSPDSPDNPTTSATAFLDGTSLAEPTTRTSVTVTQARGLSFLERYLQLFDSDRESLFLAYTLNATFSLTEEKYDTNSVPAITGHFPQILKTGRPGIVEALKKLGPDLHHSSLADIAYNIATLDDMSPGGLLLTCEGTLIPVDRSIYRQGHQCYFSRIFVLKQNDEGSRHTWPLQIAAERLIIQRKEK